MTLSHPAVEDRDMITMKPGANPFILRRVRSIRIEGGEGHVWRGGGLVVLVTLDRSHHGPLRHVSISHKHRYPTWEEIKAVRGAFIPADVDAMMMLPVEADYIDVHPNCFHIWQTPAAWGVQ